MKPHIPRTLPLKRLDWDRLKPALRRAHAALGNFKTSKQGPGEVAGFRAALTLGRNKPITFALLRQIHALLEPKAPKGERGRFRLVQNWVGPIGKPIEEAYFVPPKPERILPCLRNWKKYLAYTEKDPLVKTAILFAQLLIIHPFMDGNGRVARALIPLILLKEGVTKKPFTELSRYFKIHRRAYIDHLFQITSENDWEGWILFFLKGFSSK